MVNYNRELRETFMVSDDVFDKLCEAEIYSADLRIQYLTGSVKELEKNGRSREAKSSRELLTLIVRAQEFRRMRYKRVQAARHIKP